MLVKRWTASSIFQWVLGRCSACVSARTRKGWLLCPAEKLKRYINWRHGKYLLLHRTVYILIAAPSPRCPAPSKKMAFRIYRLDASCSDGFVITFWLECGALSFAHQTDAGTTSGGNESKKIEKNTQCSIHEGYDDEDGDGGGGGGGRADEWWCMSWWARTKNAIDPRAHRQITEKTEEMLVSLLVFSFVENIKEDVSADISVERNVFFFFFWRFFVPHTYVW